MTRKRTYAMIAAVTVVGAVVGTVGALVSAHLHFGSGHQTTGGQPGALARAGYGGPGFGARGGFGLRRGGPGGIQAAATYLGISTTQLFGDLRSGMSLADVAKATDGKSVPGLIDAMVAAEKKQIESAVGSGVLTRAQADQIESNLESRMTAVVNGTGFGPRRFAPPQVPGSPL